MNLATAAGQETPQHRLVHDGLLPSRQWRRVQRARLSRRPDLDIIERQLRRQFYGSIGSLSLSTTMSSSTAGPIAL